MVTKFLNKYFHFFLESSFCKNYLWISFISIDDAIFHRRLLVDVISIINHNGKVVTFPESVSKTSCNVNVKNYPFDNQECLIKLGSFAYTTKRMQIKCMSDTGDTESLVHNGEWELEDLPCVNKTVIYTDTEDGWDEVNYTLKLRRKPKFYLYNLLFPCLLLTFIGLMVFLLPRESGEKVSLSITVLLAMAVFMQIVMGNVPATSDAVHLMSR